MSTTSLIGNLNADLWDGYHIASFLKSGENLIKGSSNAKIVSNWEHTGWSGGLNTYDAENGVYEFYSYNGWHTVVFRLPNDYLNTELSYSCDIYYDATKSTQAVTGEFGLIKSKGYGANIKTIGAIEGNTWYHYQGKYTTNSDVAYFGIFIRGTDGAGLYTYVRVRNLKVEVGNIQTPWTPAHSDLDHTWDNLKDKPATATRWPIWSEVTDKPSTFTPASHNHDGSYLKLSGGAMTGQLKWTNGDALPQQASPEYFLSIDAFASGGTTKWSTKADTLKALTGLTSTAIGDSDEPVYWSGSAFTKCGPFASSSHTHDDRYTREYGGPSDKDFNTSDGGPNSGTYYVHVGYKTPQNCPVSYGIVQDLHYSASHLQFAATSSNQIYARSYFWTGGSNFEYPSWVSLIHSGNIASQSVNYAASAGSVEWGNVSGKPSTFTPSSHTHSYLPLSGGTMSGIITGSSGGGSWGYSTTLKASLYKSTPADSSYYPVIGGASKDGAWSYGYIGSVNSSYFSWNKSDGTNNVSIELRNTSGTIALTSDIPSTYAWSSITSKPDTATRWPSWSEVTSKPDSFTPAAHDHGRLNTATITEANLKLAQYSGFYNVSPSSSSEIPGATSSGNVCIHAAWDNGSNTAGLDLLVNDTTTSPLYFRSRVGGGGIGYWRTILDSSNYTSYVPTKTGTGASGTWPISISGSAATAGNCDTVDGKHHYNFLTASDTCYWDIPIADANNWFYVGYFATGIYIPLHIYASGLGTSMNNSVEVIMSNIGGWGKSRFVLCGTTTNTTSLIKLCFWGSRAEGIKVYVYMKNTVDSTYNYTGYRVSLYYNSNRFVPVSTTTHTLSIATDVPSASGNGYEIVELTYGNTLYANLNGNATSASSVPSLTNSEIDAIII